MVLPRYFRPVVPGSFRVLLEASGRVTHSESSLPLGLVAALPGVPFIDKGCRL